MQDRVGTVGCSLELVDRLRGRKHQQLDTSPFRLLGYILNDGQRPGGSAPDHEAFTVPRDVFAQGKWRVAIAGPEGLRTSLLALPDIPAIDHKIVLEAVPSTSIDPKENDPNRIAPSIGTAHCHPAGRRLALVAEPAEVSWSRGKDAARLS